MEKWIDELMSPAILTRALENWNLSGQAELIGDCENYIYRVPGDESFILRLTHSSHRSREEVESEFHWMCHLGRHGAPVCLPLPDLSGRLSCIIPADEGSCFIAALFREASGFWVSPGDESGHWSREAIESWGAALGLMHRATMKYVPDPSLPRRPHWRDDDLLVNARSYLTEDSYWVLEVLGRYSQSMEEQLSAIDPLDPNCGSIGLEGTWVVHADMHHGNFLYTGDEIRIFDFDDSCRHFLAFDLALPVYYVFMPAVARGGVQAAGKLMEEFLGPYLEAYLREFPQAAGYLPAWLMTFPAIMGFRDAAMTVFCAKKGYEPGERRIEDLRTGDSYRFLSTFLENFIASGISGENQEELPWNLPGINRGS